jgi:hypothetical protein
MNGLARRNSVSPCTEPFWISHCADLPAYGEKNFLKRILRVVLVAKYSANMAKEWRLNCRENFVERAQVSKLCACDEYRKLELGGQPERSAVSNAPRTRAALRDT